MGKVSFNPADAYEVKGGFQEGWFEVVDAKTAVWNFPNNARGEPFLAMLFYVNRLDQNGAVISEEPVEIMMKIESDLNKMRPGHMDSPDDQDPTDLGTELGTEGNSAYSPDGAQPNKKTKFLVFCQSLIEQGFKPDVLARSYAPDFIGLRAHAITKPGEKVKDRTTGNMQDTNIFVVDKITQFPYERKATAAKATTASTAKGKTSSPATAASGTANAAPTHSASSNGKLNAEDTAKFVMRELATKLSGNTMAMSSLRARAYQIHLTVKDRDAKLDTQVRDQYLKNAEWLTENGPDLGFVVDGDQVIFT